MTRESDAKPPKALINLLMRSNGHEPGGELTCRLASSAGRFRAEAELLRLYRSIATMNAAAPLPSLSSETPTWAAASALVRTWGLKQFADRLVETAKHSTQDQ